MSEVEHSKIRGLGVKLAALATLRAAGDPARFPAGLSKDDTDQLRDLLGRQWTREEHDIFQQAWSRQLGFARRMGRLSQLQQMHEEKSDNLRRQVERFRCEQCRRLIFRQGGYRRTGLCGPCATGDDETVNLAGVEW